MMLIGLSWCDKPLTVQSEACDSLQSTSPCGLQLKHTCLKKPLLCGSGYQFSWYVFTEIHVYFRLLNPETMTRCDGNKCNNTRFHKLASDTGTGCHVRYLNSLKLADLVSQPPLLSSSPPSFSFFIYLLFFTAVSLVPAFVLIYPRLSPACTVVILVLCQSGAGAHFWWDERVEGGREDSGSRTLYSLMLSISVLLSHQTTPLTPTSPLLPPPLLLPPPAPSSPPSFSSPPPPSLSSPHSLLQWVCKWFCPLFFSSVILSLKLCAYGWKL